MRGCINAATGVLGLSFECKAGVSEPGADRGPRAGSPRGVVDAMDHKFELRL